MVRQFRLVVPTYYGNSPESKKKEFDEPHVPVLIHEAAGVRVVLGTHDYNDMNKPDIQIERRPNGWAIFLQPIGGGDSSGFVYFLDDGRSFVYAEHPCGSTPPIELLERDEELPELDHPISNSQIALDNPIADRPLHAFGPDEPAD